MGQPEIDAVLAGEESYDSLGDADQAVVRAEWDRRIEETRASLDLEADFIAEGRTWWVVGDEHGGVVIRHLPDLDPAERAWITKRMGDDTRFEEVQISPEVLAKIEAERAVGKPGRTGRPVRGEHMDAARDAEEGDGIELGEDVVGRLVDSREELERLADDYGLSNIRVFGSVARGTQGPGSDVDLLVTASAGVGLMAVAAFGHAAADLLGVEVDVVTDGGVGPDHEVRRTAIPLSVLVQVEESRAAGPGRSGRPERRASVDAAWAAEIARRMDEVESGAVELLRWEQVKEGLDGDAVDAQAEYEADPDLQATLREATDAPTVHREYLASRGRNRWLR